MKMYKINDISEDFLSWHFDSLFEKTQKLMQGFRDGKLTFHGSVGKTKIIDFEYRVISESPTWHFLNKYSEFYSLLDLLCGSWDDMLSIIKEVEGFNAGLDWKNAFTKEKYTKGKILTQTENGAIYIDDFHDILHHIFVEELYEKQFDKLQFIKSHDLSVCPYCGRQKIDVASYANKRTSKPPIDHFFPKSKYPFLAVSFRNLIPCCTNCNEFANKGDFDPLEAGKLTLENPHEFDDSHVKFLGEYPDMLSMNKDDYHVSMAFNPKCLATGYKETLKLEAFYQKEKRKMMDMHQNLVTFSEERKAYLKAVGVDIGYLNNMQSRIIGHLLDGRISEREFYKFKKEMYEQLLKKYKMKEE